VQEVFENHPDASLSLEIAGPPDFVGRRIILTGSPDGFRLLASMLTTMADRVEDPSRPERVGWHFMVNSEVVPQLQLAPDCFLSLNCEHPPAAAR
jgi:hypothetical protein